MPQHERITTTTGQKARIIEWFEAGFSNREIVDKIDDERAKGIQYDNVSWPSVTLNQVQHIRTTFSDLIPDLRRNQFTIATQQGLATRGVMLTRIANKLGELERIIDHNNDALLALHREGILEGRPYVLQDEEVILEADYAVEGNAHIPNGKLPAALAQVRVGSPILDDPRWQHLIDLYHVQAKLYQQLVNLLTLHAKISGISNPKSLSDETTTTQQERLARAEQSLEHLVKLTRERDRRINK